MSDDQRWRQPDAPQSVPPTDGWGGEYDADVTSFIQLPGATEQPPAGVAGEGAEYSPLAAPGTGAGWEPPAIPPMTPAASTDPTATGVWTMPFAPGDEPYQAATSHDAQQTPRQPPAHSALGQGAAAALAGAHEARTPAGPPGVGGPTEPVTDQAVGAQPPFGLDGQPGAGQAYGTTAPLDPLDPATPLDVAATQGGSYGEGPEGHGEARSAWGAVERNPLWSAATETVSSGQPTAEPPPGYQPTEADGGGYQRHERSAYQGAGEPSLPQPRASTDEPGPVAGALAEETWRVPEARDGQDPLGGQESEPVPVTEAEHRRDEPYQTSPLPDVPPTDSPVADSPPTDSPLPESVSDQSPGEAEPGEAEPVEDNEHPLESYVLHVNGADRPVVDAWIGESLLYVLRERLGLAGAKDGCSQGECGACSVQVDGRLVASCLVPAVTAAESEVRTVEGLSRDGEPSDVQRTLAERTAGQCGFCVPGMAMTVHDLLEGNHAPTELEVRRALCGNLCRCSGYRGVLEAVEEVSRSRAERLREQQAAGHTGQHQPAEGHSGQHTAPRPPGAAEAEQPRIPQQSSTEELGGEQ